MLNALYGAYRLTDFVTYGHPNLDDHRRLDEYEKVVYADARGFVGMLLPNGVSNAAGETVIPPAAVNPKNLLRDASTWYQEAVLSRPPGLTGPAYVNEREEDVRRVLHRMVELCSVVGHGAIYEQDGMIHIVGGQNVFPVMEPGNPVPVGYIMAWFYYQRAENDRAPQFTQPPNRERLIYYDVASGETFRATYVYTAATVGDQIPDESDNLPPIGAFAVFGVDEGFYREGLKILREIAGLDAVIRELGTTYSIPVPVTSSTLARQGSTGILDPQGNVILRGQRRGLQNVSVDAPPLEFVAAMQDLAQLQEERELWLQRLASVTRIPRDVVETGADNDLSEVSRAMAAKPAQDWILAVERSISAGLSAVIAAIAGSGVTVDWNANPFTTEAEGRLVARSGWEGGLLTRNEAREAMGRDPVEGGDVFNTGGAEAAIDGEDEQQEE